LTPDRLALDDRAMGDTDPGLDSRESARNRRRDRDADAQARDLMRPGMGKVFKQIGDAQAKAARPTDSSAKKPRSVRKPRRS
jgi:hypothetical protein